MIFLSTIATFLAAGSIVWTLIDVAGQLRVPHDTLGTGSAPAVRAWGPAHVASMVSIGMLLLLVSHSLLLGVATSRLATLGPFDLVAFSAVGAAAFASLIDCRRRYALAELYAYALAAVGAAQTWRGFSPGRFFAWGIVSDLAGFVLIAALAGWLLQVARAKDKSWRWAKLDRDWPTGWFLDSQAALAAVAAVLTTWVSMDLSFDGTGQGVALFGLSGRSASCTAALMLLGATILMAWQTQGQWRTAWQCAAFAAGLLFTSSLGWARIDERPSDASVWLQRCNNLLISATMMTVMTRFGLARVLPAQSDWIPLARRLSPIIGGLAVMALVAVVLQRM